MRLILNILFCGLLFICVSATTVIAQGDDRGGDALVRGASARKQVKLPGVAELFKKISFAPAPVQNQLDFDTRFLKIKEELAKANKDKEQIASYDAEGKLNSGQLFEAKQSMDVAQQDFRKTPLFSDAETSVGSLVVVNKESLARLEKAKADLALAKEKVRQQQNNLVGTEKLVASLSSAQTSLLKEKDNALKALDVFIQTKGVQTDLSKYLEIYNDSNEVLEHIAKVYDKSAMGSYMAERFAQLLNDKNLFCQAQNNCSSKTPADISFDQVKDSIFNSYVRGVRPRARAPGTTK